MITIQLATPDQVDNLWALDEGAGHDPERRQFIQRAVAGKTSYVATAPDIAGYAVLDYSFFTQGFIVLLYVQTDWRRQGVGQSLLEYLETVCQTGKLFTSTNLSNLPMQRLLAKLNYRLSGVVHDLDEGDPELIYVKYLR